ncbi:hypothetical protein LINPERPRIM_LOCUS40049 [Linum perenne]
MRLTTRCLILIAELITIEI